MLHVLAYSSNKRHWIIWVVLLYFTWELNKDYTVTEDPSRYPGIGPSTIQPQHVFLNLLTENSCCFWCEERKKIYLLVKSKSSVSTELWTKIDNEIFFFLPNYLSLKFFFCNCQMTPLKIKHPRSEIFLIGFKFLLHKSILPSFSTVSFKDLDLRYRDD